MEPGRGLAALAYRRTLGQKSQARNKRKETKGEEQQANNKFKPEGELARCSSHPFIERINGMQAIITSQLQPLQLARPQAEDREIAAHRRSQASSLTASCRADLPC